MPIKAEWWNTSLAFFDFSRSNNHCIHLSTKTIYFFRFVFAMSAFAPIEIFSNTVYNKSAAEAWLCLVSFYGGEWWCERLHCHMCSPQNNHLKYVTSYFHYFFTGSKFSKHMYWKCSMFCRSIPITKVNIFAFLCDPQQVL